MATPKVCMTTARSPRTDQGATLQVPGLLNSSNQLLSTWAGTDSGTVMNEDAPV